MNLDCPMGHLTTVLALGLNHKENFSRKRLIMSEDLRNKVPITEARNLSENFIAYTPISELEKYNWNIDLYDDCSSYNEQDHPFRTSKFT